eukprot:Skav201104  [mRNA]  locus=scaffold497:129888:132403:+ [translate_table: standard]
MSSAIDSQSWKWLPASQAKLMAQMDTPTSTATAMLVKYDSRVTTSTTKASIRGTLRCRFSRSLQNLGNTAARTMPKENHLKV